MFFEKLDDLLHKLENNKKKSSRIVLCGDWNINLLRANKHTQTLTDILHNYNIKIYIKTPTRKNACLDIVASNIQGCKGITENLYLSDHNTCQILSFYTNNYHKTKYWTEYKTDFSYENIYKFYDYINSLTFNDVLQEKDTNKSFNLFHDIFMLLFDQCFPLIKLKCSNKPKKINWITKGLKQSCKHKRILYYSYLKSDKTSKKQNKYKYIKYSKMLQKCINSAQKLCNSNIIHNAKNKCRASWQIIHNNLDNKKLQNDIDMIIHNDITYINLSDITNIFNDYFININDNDNYLNSNKTTNRTNIMNSIYLTPTSEDEIDRIITNLQNTNSVGYDNINTNILKIVSKKISYPLTHIINQSLENGIFPDRLKLSVVKPLHKGGNETDMNNYRPIALIPVIAKIFEKVMAKRIQSFIKQNNIIHDRQFGFQEGKSTTLACFTLVTKITECINNNITNVALFLDMSKAFDCVKHSILLKKISDYGIRGKANSWLTSYLENRKQCTEISRIENNEKLTVQSDYKQIKNGVPQGSILGPLLFLLYINDLPDVTKNDCFLFADDCTILFKNKNIDILKSDIHNTLTDIYNWMNNNNLRINIGKTKAIHFHTYKASKINLNITVNNDSIAMIKDTKFLGITIDEHCSWKNHIEILCKKVNKFVFALGRIRKIASFEIALQAYYGHVASLLRYGLIIWGNSVDIERAFRAQKKCIRALCNIGTRESCKPLFKKHKILTLPCLYIADLCLFVKQYPNFFETHSQKSKQPNVRDLRKNKLCYPKINLTLYNKNVYCMAIRIFNKLPNDLRDLPYEKNKFKNGLNHWLADRCFYKIAEYLND